MFPFDKCPVCGGEVEKKMVEKLLRGGHHTVSLKVASGVCLHCGERLYSEDAVRSFEEIRNKLTGKYSLLSSIMLDVSFVIFALLTYFMTPKDEKEDWNGSIISYYT